MKHTKRKVLDWVNIIGDSIYAIKMDYETALIVVPFIEQMPEWRLNSFPIKIHLFILKRKIKRNECLDEIEL